MISSLCVIIIVMIALWPSGKAADSDSVISLVRIQSGQPKKDNTPFRSIL